MGHWIITVAKLNQSSFRRVRVASKINFRSFSILKVELNLNPGSYKVEKTFKVNFPDASELHFSTYLKLQ